jgi:hypothetical protein
MSASLSPDILELEEDASGGSGFNGFNGFDGLLRSGGRRRWWCLSHDRAFRSSSIGLLLICPKSTHSLRIDEGQRTRTKKIKKIRVVTQHRDSEGNN